MKLLIPRSPVSPKPGRFREFTVWSPLHDRFCGNDEQVKFSEILEIVDTVSGCINNVYEIRQKVVMDKKQILILLIINTILDSRLRGNEEPTAISDRILRGNEELAAISDRILRGNEAVGVFSHNLLRNSATGN